MLAVLFRDVFKAGNISVYHFAVAAIVLIIFLSIYQSARIKRTTLLQNLTFGVIFVWLALSPIWAGVSGDYWLFMGWVVFGYVTFFISRDLYLLWDRKKYLRVLAYVYCALLLLAIFETITGVHLPSSRIHVYDHLEGIPAATFWNQNDFAFYLVLFLGATLGVCRSKAARIGVMLCVVYLLLVIASLAAWIGFVIFVLAYLFARRKRLGIVVGGVTVAAVAGLVQIEAFRDVGAMRRIYGYRYLIDDPEIVGYSVALRADLIRSAWMAFADTYGLGLGAGGVREALRSAGSEIVTLHNFPLEILFNAGIGVFIVVAGAYLLGVYGLYARIDQTDNSSTDERIYAGIWASLVCLPFASIGPAFVIYVSVFWMWLGVVCGIVAEDRMSYNYQHAGGRNVGGHG